MAIQYLGEMTYFIYNFRNDYIILTVFYLVVLAQEQEIDLSAKMVTDTFASS
jgi:hypothetical protein